MHSISASRGESSEPAAIRHECAEVAALLEFEAMGKSRL